MIFNMGTPNNPEGVEHFSVKALLFSYLREKAKVQESVWLFFREYCGKCRDDGGITLVNVLENVRRVTIEEDYPAGNFRPDITLWGASTETPEALIEVENTTPVSQGKEEYCKRHNIPIYVFDARRLTGARPSRVLGADKVIVHRCWSRERQRDDYLIHRLYQFPDGVDIGNKTECRIGIKQAVGLEAIAQLVNSELYTDLAEQAANAATSFVCNLPPVKRAQRYVVGDQDVSKAELQRIVVRHLLSLDWGKGNLSSRITYDALLEVMHEIHMENNIPVEEWKPEHSSASDAKSLRGTLVSDVLVYPKRLGFQGATDRVAEAKVR